MHLIHSDPATVMSPATSIAIGARLSCNSQRLVEKEKQKAQENCLIPFPIPDPILSQCKQCSIKPKRSCKKSISKASALHLDPRVPSK